MTAFRENLGRDPEADDYQFLFHVRGNAGVGKTSLVQQAESGSSAQPPEPSLAGSLAAQAGLAGLGVVPVVGALAGAVDPQQVAQGADRLRAALGCGPTMTCSWSWTRYAA
ncbi:hypothetical protein [Streptomyces sp. NBC_00696]|uniref:hypothetical protein n=1 Tax=Streptomyces sp. NBC_00696 TaxID=2903672 RepID=UPI002E360F07|nr:hypothetical protein [Streptomyces sp. NBC_00696]